MSFMHSAEFDLYDGCIQPSGMSGGDKLPVAACGHSRRGNTSASWWSNSTDSSSGSSGTFGGSSVSAGSSRSNSLGHDSGHGQLSSPVIHLDRAMLGLGSADLPNSSDSTAAYSGALQPLPEHSAPQDINELLASLDADGCPGQLHPSRHVFSPQASAASTVAVSGFFSSTDTAASCSCGASGFQPGAHACSWGHTAASLPELSASSHSAPEFPREPSGGELRGSSLGLRLSPSPRFAPAASFMQATDSNTRQQASSVGSAPMDGSRSLALPASATADMHSQPGAAPSADRPPPTRPPPAGTRSTSNDPQTLARTADPSQTANQRWQSSGRARGLSLDLSGIRQAPSLLAQPTANNEKPYSTGATYPEQGAPTTEPSQSAYTQLQQSLQHFQHQYLNHALVPPLDDTSYPSYNYKYNNGYPETGPAFYTNDTSARPMTSLSSGSSPSRPTSAVSHASHHVSQDPQQGWYQSYDRRNDWVNDVTSYGPQGQSYQQEPYTSQNFPFLQTSQEQLQGHVQQSTPNNGDLESTLLSNSYPVQEQYNAFDYGHTSTHFASSGGPLASNSSSSPTRANCYWNTASTAGAVDYNAFQMDGGVGPAQLSTSHLQQHSHMGDEIQTDRTGPSIFSSQGSAQQPPSPYLTSPVTSVAQSRSAGSLSDTIAPSSGIVNASPTAPIFPTAQQLNAGIPGGPYYQTIPAPYNFQNQQDTTAATGQGKPLQQLSNHSNSTSSFDFAIDDLPLHFDYSKPGDPQLVAESPRSINKDDPTDKAPLYRSTGSSRTTVSRTSSQSSANALRTQRVAPISYASDSSDSGGSDFFSKGQKRRRPGAKPVSGAADGAISSGVTTASSGNSQERVEKSSPERRSSLRGNDPQQAFSGGQAHFESNPMQNYMDALPQLSALQIDRQTVVQTPAYDYPTNSSLHSGGASVLSTDLIEPQSPVSVVSEDSREKRESGQSSGASSSGGRRLYECKICSRKFPRPSALTVHERIHSGEKPFVCEFCDRPFTVASNLRRHQKIHAKQQSAMRAKEAADVSQSSGDSTIKAPPAAKAKLEHRQEDGATDTAQSQITLCNGRREARPSSAAGSAVGDETPEDSDEIVYEDGASRVSSSLENHSQPTMPEVKDVDFALNGESPQLSFSKQDASEPRGSDRIRQWAQTVEQ